MVPARAPGAYLSRPQLYGGFGGFKRDELPKATEAGYDDEGIDLCPDYGGIPALGKSSPVFHRGQRLRLNIVSMFQCFLLPWLLFCLVYALMSFRLHYTSRVLCWAAAVLVLIAIWVCGLLAMVWSHRKWAPHAELLDGISLTSRRTPSWIAFLLVSSLAAWVLAVIVGNMNYQSHLRPYYEYGNLNAHMDVDPTTIRGQQVMDAGRVGFTNGSTLDLSLSMGFRNYHTYCVAPITVLGTSSAAGGGQSKPQPLESYDFWAVGLDCCSTREADFHCGQFNSATAHQGLRVLRDEQRPFFRLAVQQAEAVHGIKTGHPLFFYWVADAAREASAFRDEGYKYFLIGMLAHFMWQILSVSLAALAFSKLGRL